MARTCDDREASLASVRVLVAEDESIVALDLERTFIEAGAEVIGPAATLAQALALARDEIIDVAILDVRLGRETSGEVAALLMSRGVPLVVYSGQVDDAFDVRQGEAVLLSKPATRKMLISAVAKLLAQAASR
jgi:DNA-binding NtrC family response regulator